MKGENGKEGENLEKSFLAAYDQYAPNILRHICFRISDKESAKDLTSETFMRTWQYLKEGKEIKNFKSFLYRICNNLIVDYYRDKDRRNIPLEGIKEPQALEESNLVKIERRFDFETVKKHFDSLPQDYQDILIYRFVDDLSIREIKEASGKSIINIYTICHRALKILKQKLKRYEG